MWNNGQKKESLYVIAMVDYLCRLHNWGTYEGYQEYRRYKLEEPLYPQDMRLAKMLGVEIPKGDLIPEFARFNIIEGEIMEEQYPGLVNSENANDIILQRTDSKTPFLDALENA